MFSFLIVFFVINCIILIYIISFSWSFFWLLIIEVIACLSILIYIISFSWVFFCTNAFLFPENNRRATRERSIPMVVIWAISISCHASCLLIRLHATEPSTLVCFFWHIHTHITHTRTRTRTQIFISLLAMNATHMCHRKHADILIH